MNLTVLIRWGVFSQTVTSGIVGSSGSTSQPPPAETDPGGSEEMQAASGEPQQLEARSLKCDV